MNIVNLSCTSCGAPIQVPPDTDRMKCPYCSSNLEIQRSEGQVAFKMGQQVSKSIEDAGVQTRDTIQQGTMTTQSELKRLQLSQQVSMLQMQLSTLQAEIRSLQREKKATRATKKQIIELKQQEASLISQIRTTQSALIEMPVVQAGSSPSVVAAGTVLPKGMVIAPAQPKNWWVAYLLCLLLGVFGAHRFYTGYTTLGIIQFLTGGGFVVWWLVDLVQLTLGKFKDSNGNLLDSPVGNSRKIVILVTGVWILMIMLMCLITGIAGQSGGA